MAYARPCAARLLGGALEDPSVLHALLADGVRSVDFVDPRAQAAYALLCHLTEGGRLTSPSGSEFDRRSGAAVLNLRVISDWMIERLREMRDDAHAHRADAVGGGDRVTGVPSDADLLLDAAARLPIVWWVELWESAWPPAPPVERDRETLRRQRSYDALEAVGIRLCQRGNSRTLDPEIMVDEALERLHHIDPDAIVRFLTRSIQAHPRADPTRVRAVPERCR